MKTEFVNLESLYDPSRLITNPQPLTKEKTFSDDGLFSERLFGKNNSDNELLSYSCECGKYKGKFLKGFVCEECKTEVKYQEPMLEKLAWISLGKYHIINPVFYYEIAKLTSGVQKLNDIISYDKKIDKDGNIIEDEKGKFNNSGLVFFKENFFEGEKILDYLYENSKYKNKDTVYNLLIEHQDKVFLQHIPVYDTLLRPASVTYKDKPVFKFDEINNSYNFIIKLSNMINKESKDFDLVVLPNLFNIQNKMILVFNKIIENLAGKSGFIRSSVLGSRLNYSCRTVITPMEAGYDVTEIVFPYLAFVELYSFQLINMLSKLKKISMLDAQRIVYDAQANFNREVYNLCLELVKKTKHGLLVIGIRNPTIARGSVQVLKIAHVKDDISDLTTSVHNCILELWGGDYDGDVVNFFPLMDNEYKTEFYRVFSPDKMFISNNTGAFNAKLSIDRDQVIGIHQFNLD